MDMYPGWERSEMQKRFHEGFLQAVALHIYREDADVDMDAICRMNDWPNLKQQISNLDGHNYLMPIELVYTSLTFFNFDCREDAKTHLLVHSL